MLVIQQHQQTVLKVWQWGRLPAEMLIKHRQAALRPTTSTCGQRQPLPQLGSLEPTHTLQDPGFAFSHTGIWSTALPPLFSFCGYFKVKKKRVRWGKKGNEELRIYAVHLIKFSMHLPAVPISLGNRAVFPLPAAQLPSVCH